MSIRVPTPLHGWRVLAGEVGIVTLGVLIALGAQQAVSEWVWRSDVRQAEHQLTAESLDNFQYAAERVMVQPCIDAQIDRAIALAMAPAARLTPMAPIPSVTGDVSVRQPSRPYRDSGWTGVVGDGIASHMDNDRRDLYASAYTQIANLREQTSAGDDTINRLNLLLYPIELTPDVRAHLIEDLSAEKRNGRLMTLVGVQIMDQLWALGKAPSAPLIETFLTTSGTLKLCRDKQLPLGNWRATLQVSRNEAITWNTRLAQYVKRPSR